MTSKRANHRGSSCSRSPMQSSCRGASHLLQQQEQTRAIKGQLAYRPPTGVRGYKALRLLKQHLQQNQEQIHDTHQDDPFAVELGYEASLNQLQSITGKFARPLQPVPGVEPVHEDWQDITKAPVVMQVEEILGHRFQESFSSGYNSEGFRNQILRGDRRTPGSQPSVSSAATRSLTASYHHHNRSRHDALSSSTSLEKDAFEPACSTSLYTGIVYFNDEQEQPKPVRSSKATGMTPSSRQLSKSFDMELFKRALDDETFDNGSDSYSEDEMVLSSHVKHKLEQSCISERQFVSPYEKSSRTFEGSTSNSIANSCSLNSSCTAIHSPQTAPLTCADSSPAVPLFTTAIGRCQQVSASATRAPPTTVTAPCTPSPGPRRRAVFSLRSLCSITGNDQFRRRPVATGPPDIASHQQFPSLLQ